MAPNKEKKFVSDYPELLAEWDWEENSKMNLFPDKTTHGAKKKAKWRCSTCGGTYDAWIYSRTSRHSGCPICRNRLIVVGLNDIATTHPQLAEEWNYSRNGTLRPTDVVAGCNTEVWWKCKEQHEWKATVNSRSAGRNCPICAGAMRPATRQESYLLKYGSLRSNYPDIAAQWHPEKNGDLSSDNITSGSKRGIWWLCEKGHEWKAPVYSRVAGNGCPECNYEHSTSFPEQILFFYLSQATRAINRYQFMNKEIDVYLPELKVGIEYNGRYYHSNRKLQDEKKRYFFQENGIRLITVHEGDKTLLEGDTIYYRYINSDYLTMDSVVRYILNLCALPLMDIDIGRDRSQIFEQYIQQEKADSLAAKYPWTIEEWDYEKNGKLTPWQISHGSKKRVYWVCKKCGYEWSAVAHTRGKSGCPCCANRVVVPGKNDLATTHPHLAEEWDYEKNEKKPTDFVAGSKQYAWWVCKEGHSWEAQIKSRKQGTGCSECAKMKRKALVDVCEPPDEEK